MIILVLIKIFKNLISDQYIYVMKGLLLFNKRKAT